jgi:hypothetical protein
MRLDLTELLIGNDEIGLLRDRPDVSGGEVPVPHGHTVRFHLHDAPAADGFAARNAVRGRLSDHDGEIQTLALEGVTKQFQKSPTISRNVFLDDYYRLAST